MENKTSFTQEQIDNRTSDYVCWDCGTQFLTAEQKKEAGYNVTAHENNCGLCGEKKGVTHIRAWNRLRIGTPLTKRIVIEMFEHLDTKGEHSLVQCYKNKILDSDISAIIQAWAVSIKELDEIIEKFWNRHIQTSRI